jgi:ketosteroid isomerase-like protein
MRKWVLGIAVLGVSLSSGIQPVSAQTPQTVNGAMIALTPASPQAAKQAIAQLYQAMDDALNQRDVTRLGSFMAPEYTSTGLDEIVKNRQQSLQTTAEGFRMFPQLKSQTQLKQIKIDGKTATVNGVTSFRGTAINPNNAQDTRAIAGEQSFQDVLQLVGQEWKVVTSRTLSQKLQVEPSPKQQTRDRDYTQVSLMGMNAASGCYQQGRLDDCAKFERIVATLATWCESDSQACQVSMDLLGYVQMIQYGK